MHDFWDRGLLGIALDPGFTTGRPYVYVLYAYDKAPPAHARRAGATGARRRPAPTADGCVITGRLSRLTPTGAETVLIEDWCQQYPSHSIGSIEFGPDGSCTCPRGDGASFNWADYGQDGNPVNPCGDPPAADAQRADRAGRRAARAGVPAPGAQPARSTARSCA